MRSRLVLLLRLLRLTLLPPWPTGPRTFRRLALLLFFVPGFLILQGIHWLGFLLDDLLFRKYREVEIREPLFVVGLPRSGTSFLQRVLARDRRRFTTLRLWELLLAPSVTERRFWLALGRVDRLLGRPVQRLFSRGEKRGFRWMEAIHQVSVTDPEEDFFLLLPVFACFLLVVPFPYHEALWKLARFDELPAEEREPILAFYRSALQRHLYVVGPERQLLSKNPAFTPFIRSLLETFPDGRVLCCVRDPQEVVPSQLSSLRPGARLFGYEISKPEIRDRFVDMLAFFAHHALAVLPGLPEDRYAFVPLPELKKDVRGFVLGLYRRFGWQANPDFRAALEEDAARGRAHRSRHRYSLEEFGLEPGEVRERFGELVDRFGWNKEGGDDRSGSGASVDPSPNGEEA
jgi:hypothetical protein